MSLRALPSFPSARGLPDHQYKTYHTIEEPSLEQYKERSWEYHVRNLSVLFDSFFTLFFTYYNLFTLAFSFISTVFCYKMKLLIEMPISFYSVGLFFPISFGISWTISRRENLLQAIAEMKTGLLDIYFCIREWEKEGSGVADRYRNICRRLLTQVRRYAMHEGVPISDVYECISDISILLGELRVQDDWVKGLITRPYQYRRQVILSIERIKIMHDYRTPSTLRAYGMVFSSLCPVLFAPHFANISYKYGYWAGIFGGLVTSLLVSILNRVFNEQEDPMDSSGRDDLDLDVLIQTVDLMY